MAEPVDDVQINDEAVKKGFTKLNDQLRCLRSELNQGLNDIREGQRKQQEMLELLLGRVGFTFNGVTTAGQAEFCEDSPFPQHRRPQIYSPLAATPSNTNKYRSPYQSPSASRQPYRPMSKSKLNFQVDDRGIPIVQKSPSSSPGTFNFTPNITPRRRKNQPSPQPSVTSTAEGGVTQPPLSSASTASNSPLPSAEEGVIIHGVVESPSPEDKSSMTREKVHQTLSSIQTATSKKMPPAKIYMAYDTLPMNLISSFAADSGWDVILNPKFVANKDMLWESYGPPPFSSMQDADFRYLWGVWKNGRQFEEMRKGKKVILQGPSIRWLEETFGPSWRVGNSRSKYFKRFATILEHMEVVRKYYQGQTEDMYKYMEN
ncbi:hypothetical protein BKA69DRAFT_115891 [Paraphysoderma sedebokerense]|nr:hypothetical protein BKA69DRAFT_115891 [Paraphysoderma sedebokerense]